MLATVFALFHSVLALQDFLELASKKLDFNWLSCDPSTCTTFAIEDCFGIFSALHQAACPRNRLHVISQHRLRQIYDFALEGLCFSVSLQSELLRSWIRLNPKVRLGELTFLPPPSGFCVLEFFQSWNWG